MREGARQQGKRAGRGERGEQHAKGALCIGLGMRCAFFVSASAAAAADQVQLADSAVSFFLAVFFCASLACLAFILGFYLCLLVLAVWLCG